MSGTKRKVFGAEFKAKIGLEANYGKFVEQGEVNISKAVDCNSHNTPRLEVEEMRNLLLNLPCMQAIARGEFAQGEV